MQEQPYEKDGVKDLPKAENTSSTDEIDTLLAAAFLQVDEHFHRELEERLVSKLQARQVGQSSAKAMSQSAVKRIRRDALPAPLLRTAPVSTSTFRHGISRAATFLIGVVGIALLGGLFVLMSVMLGSRQSEVGNPTVQPEKGPYSAYATEGSLHIAVVAGYNLRDYKPGRFLFFYAMRSSQQGTPIVTTNWQPSTSNHNFSAPRLDKPIPNPVSTASTSTAISSASITPTTIHTETLKVTGVQSLGRLGDFQVGVIYTEWAQPPAQSTLELLVAPPGGKEVAWRVTPLVDTPADILGDETSFFNSSPAEMGQVSVACPCGPQAFRLAILGRPIIEAPPIIVGIDPYGAATLITEAEYFRIISPQGTPFPTEDTEHVYIAPTYPPTITPPAPEATK